MTDPSFNNRRLDLRALDAAMDATRDNAVITEVMSRIASETPGAADDITRLVRAQRRLLAVAAVLAAIAAAAVLASPRRPAESPTPAPEVIASWTESRHVPTNGELLAVYQGYRP